MLQDALNEAQNEANAGALHYEPPVYEKVPESWGEWAGSTLLGMAAEPVYRLLSAGTYDVNDPHWYLQKDGVLVPQTGIFNVLLFSLNIFFFKYDGMKLFVQCFITVIDC